MELNTIHDLKETSEAQVESQMISYALNLLSINVSQNILSESTRKLLIAAVEVWETGAYRFIKGNERDIFAAVLNDNLQDQLRHITPHTHARDLLGQLGI